MKQRIRAIVPVALLVAALAIPAAALAKKSSYEDAASRILQRSERRLQGYDAFLEKWESRRDKLVDRGVDVSTADAAARLARQELAAARNIYKSVAESYTAIDPSQDTPTIRRQLREGAGEMQQAFVAVHKSMAAAVQQLKQAQPQE